MKPVDTDTNSPLAQAYKEVAEEQTKEAVKILKDKLRALKRAEIVVANLKREIEDLNAKITNGTFDIR